MKRISKITVITILAIIIIGIFCNARADMSAGSSLEDRYYDDYYTEQELIKTQEEKMEKMKKMVYSGIGAVVIIGALVFFLTRKEEKNEETKTKEPIKPEVDEETKKE